jgi:hypothetical protein
MRAPWCLDKFGATGLHSTMRAIAAWVASVLGLTLGCVSTSVPVAHEGLVIKTPARDAPPPAVHETAQKTPPRVASTSAALPLTCSGSGRDCYPPTSFVRTLCQKRYPSVAVVMFNRTAPWQHAYVRVKDVMPFNSFGGPSAHSRLEFLEEVLLLRERQPKKQQQQMMILDAPVSYDVLRFDGTCATLVGDEFMLKKPVVRPHYAPIIWQQIDTRVRLALAENTKISEAAEAQNSACQGTFLAGGGETCRDSTQRLTRAIMTVLSEGVALPLPAKLPDWTGVTTADQQQTTGCPGNPPC